MKKSEDENWLEEEDDPIVNFGKYRGWKAKDVEYQYCVWALANVGCLDSGVQRVFSEIAASERALAAYLKNYNLNVFQNGIINLRKFFNLAGVPWAKVEVEKGVFANFSPSISWGKLGDGLFSNQGKILGRNGVPVVLMGHPISIGSADYEEIDFWRDRGLQVNVSSDSVISDTMQVEVTYMDFKEKLVRKCKGCGEILIVDALSAIYGAYCPNEECNRV